VKRGLALENRERRMASQRFGFAVHARDQRGGRRFEFERAGETIDLGFTALDDDLDAVGAVAHPTRQVVRSREPVDERTKTDALHDTENANALRNYGGFT